MYKILEFIEFIFGNFISLIVINSIFLLIKIHILRILFSQKINSTPLKTARFYLFIILIGGLFEDLAWISIALREFFLFPSHGIIFVILRFLTRISWLFFVFEYLFLTFFLETLIEPFSKNKLKS